MPHIAGAMLVTLIILVTGVFVLNQFPNHRTLRPAAVAMFGCTFLQVFLGLLAYWVRADNTVDPTMMVVSTVAHVAGGGLTLASSVVLSIQIRRNVRAAEPASARGHQAEAAS